MLELAQRVSGASCRMGDRAIVPFATESELDSVILGDSRVV